MANCSFGNHIILCGRVLSLIPHWGCRTWSNWWIWVQKGCKDFSDTPKCSQCPHLYQSYEATYTLKCLFFEKIAKNEFLPIRDKKICFSRFSRKISILGHMLLHNSNINVTIANILVYQKSLYDLPGRKCKNVKKSKWARPKRAWFLEMSHDWRCLPKSEIIIEVLQTKLRWKIPPTRTIERDCSQVQD